MIAKEKTTSHAGKFGEAGDKAEEQMAYYLKREFGAAPDVFVFNDLRIVHDELPAQIDHLVLHRCRIMIIESKSVTSRVCVNRQGEWKRFWNGREHGMASPLQQAKSQSKILFRLLEDHVTELLDKVVGGLLQARFGGCRAIELVAVSDSGIIERDGITIPDVMKADQICGRIHEELARHKRAHLRLGITDPDYGMYKFNRKELGRLVTFLLAQHKPLKEEAPVEAPADPPVAQLPASPKARVVTPAAPQAKASKPRAASRPKTPATPPATPKPPSDNGNVKRPPAALTCKHCASGNIYATHGPYGYYFKCRDCEGNTPIDYTCTACGRKGRIGKSRDSFDRVCAECGHEERVWVNTSDS